MTEPGVVEGEGADHPGHRLLPEVLEVLMSSTHALVVVGADRRVVLANLSARAMLGLSELDLGRRFTDLGIARTVPELVSRVADALEGRVRGAMRAVPWSAGSATTHLDIEVVPVVGGSGRIEGTAVTLTDATRWVELRREVEGARRELRAAYAELQSTTEELTATVEELKATNEELTATIGELDATRSVVQLTSEQLRDRSSAVTQLNAFMQSIVDSLDGAVIVVDPDLVVQAWSRRAEELWGLRELETVGQPLLSLDSGLPGRALRPWLVAVVEGAERRIQQRHVEGVDRRGRTVDLRVTVTAMLSAEDDATGALVLFEETSESTST